MFHLFALDGTKEFGERVAGALNMPRLSRHREYTFHDGEVYAQSEENVRNSDVFVIHSLYSDRTESVNDKIMKLFIFLGSLHDASAGRITLVSPIMAYARQDRKTASRAPITTKYLSHLFQSVFVKRVLTLDAHNPGAYQNAFSSVHFDNLEANGLFAKYVKEELNVKNLTVMSPDEGGLKRARKFRSFLASCLDENVDIACMDKTHEGLEIKGNGLMGNVSGKNVVIIDDMISSGKTILECVETAKKYGANKVLAVFASHGLFVGESNEYLDSDFINKIVITDTIPPFRVTNPRVLKKISVVHTHNLFAEAIRRTHKGESISDLIEKNFMNLKFTVLRN